MIKFKFFFDDEFLASPIEVLELSARSWGGLKRDRIETIGDVVDNWDRLGKIRNLGKKSVKEIHAAVFAKNLHRIWDNEELMQKFADGLEVYT